MDNLLRYIAGFVLIVLFQVLIFNRIEPGYSTYIMIYPLFFLVLPFKLSTPRILLIAFGVGFVLDAFMNTYGLHTSSALFIVYMRPIIYKIIAPNEEYIRGSDSGKYSSVFKFLVILFIFMLLHHTWFFILESFTLNELLFTLLRIVMSTIASTFITFVIFVLFLTKTNVE